MLLGGSTEGLTWAHHTDSRYLLQVNHQNVLINYNTAWCSSCSALNRMSPHRVVNAAHHIYGGVSHPALREGGRTEQKREPQHP